MAIGRPKLEIVRVKKSVTLHPRTIETLTVLGGGNLSAGIELALQNCLASRTVTNQPPIEALEKKPKKKKG